MSRGARLTAHGAVSASLALHSDAELSELVDAAVPLGSGIGGKSALLEVCGVPVFVKRVPLTDWERRPENIRSTANLFGLPMICHYGIGGPGFGAWRELAVHAMTTGWVLADEFDGFPVMYHWRILPDSTPLPDELADVERVVAYWGGGSAHQWLGRQVDAGAEATDRACTTPTGEQANPVPGGRVDRILRINSTPLINRASARTGPATSAIGETCCRHNGFGDGRADQDGRRQADRDDEP
ncbi:hypothetical protein ACTWPB_27660 [Nocardia sp. IBHARD005]|uniref:hypothetical protein n=1 Tax=Nocardia sp. IBHARD005 TaxID=3457765 RepID=UPI00405A0CEE